MKPLTGRLNTVRLLPVALRPAPLRVEVRIFIAITSTTGLLAESIRRTHPPLPASFESRDARQCLGFRSDWLDSESQPLWMLRFDLPQAQQYRSSNTA